MDIQDLLKVHIRWKKTGGHPQWSAVVNNEIYGLRMNDFPEEPLYPVCFLSRKAAEEN
jgi:hypothetical protein